MVLVGVCLAAAASPVGSHSLLTFESSFCPSSRSPSCSCVRFQTAPLVRVDPHCVPHTCHLWDATLQSGLLRVPPPSPEPAMSVVANVWAPKLLPFVSSNARWVLPMTLAATLVLAVLLLRFVGKQAVKLWRAALPVRNAIRWASSHPYAQEAYSFTPYAAAT